MFNKCRERVTYLALMLISQSFRDDLDSFAPKLAPYLFLRLSTYKKDQREIQVTKAYMAYIKHKLLNTSRSIKLKA